MHTSHSSSSLSSSITSLPCIIIMLLLLIIIILILIIILIHDLSPRNLSLDNLLLTSADSDEDYELKLVDFASAERVVPYMIMPGKVDTMLEYAAPEMLQVMFYGE